MSMQWNYFGHKKRNELLIHTRTWMDPENTVLIERSQAQKVTFICMIIIYMYNSIYVKHPEQGNL